MVVAGGREGYKQRYSTEILFTDFYPGVTERDINEESNQVYKHMHIHTKKHTDLYQYNLYELEQFRMIIKYYFTSPLQNVRHTDLDKTVTEFVIASSELVTT